MTAARKPETPAQPNVSGQSSNVRRLKPPPAPATGAGPDDTAWDGYVWSEDLKRAAEAGAAKPDNSAQSSTVRSEKLLGAPALTTSECVRIVGSIAAVVAAVVGVVVWVVKS